MIERRDSMEEALRISVLKEWRSFSTTFNENFSLGPTSQVRTGGWRFLKRQAKPEGSEFPLSRAGLSKERLSSSWNRSLKLIFTTARVHIGHGAQRTGRWIEWCTGWCRG